MTVSEKRNYSLKNKFSNKNKTKLERTTKNYFKEENKLTFAAETAKEHAWCESVVSLSFPLLFLSENKLLKRTAIRIE